jgi:hypothetical protein
MTDDEEREYARRQIEKSATGEADGQCPSCLVYRTDGQLPVLHHADCTIAEHDGGNFRWRLFPSPPPAP